MFQRETLNVVKLKAVKVKARSISLFYGTKSVRKLRTAETFSTVHFKFV